MSAPMSPGEWAAMLQQLARDLNDDPNVEVTIIVPEYRLEADVECPECGAMGTMMAFYGSILGEDGVDAGTPVTRDDILADMQSIHDEMYAPCTARVTITVTHDTGPQTWSAVLWATAETVQQDTWADVVFGIATLIFVAFILWMFMHD